MCDKIHFVWLIDVCTIGEDEMGNPIPEQTMAFVTNHSPDELTWADVISQVREPRQYVGCGVITGPIMAIPAATK